MNVTVINASEAWNQSFNTRFPSALKEQELSEDNEVCQKATKVMLHSFFQPRSKMVT